MDEISETQARMEQSLNNLNEFLSLLRMNRTEPEVVLPPITLAMTIPQVTPTMTIPQVTPTMTISQVTPTMTIPQVTPAMTVPPFTFPGVFPFSTTTMTISPFTSTVWTPPLTTSTPYSIAQTMTSEIPIGDGYQPLRNVNAELYGSAETMWGQPHLSAHGQPIGTRSGIGHTLIEKD